MMHGWGWNGPMGLSGGIFSLLIVTVLILGGFWVIRSIYRGRNDESRLDEYHDAADAQEVLRQRYARGEVSREEFLAMKEDMG